MKEQVYRVEEVKSFEPKHIFECGQCFRWNKERDNSYTGIIGKNILNVKKENGKVIIKGKCTENIEELCIHYFDLHTNYEKIKQTLAKVDENMKRSVQYGQGIRILHQEIWETLISFIISANNNIPRIKRIIESLSQTYGEKIVWKGKPYYTFPTAEELSKASIKDLRRLGLGFRDRRVFETTKMVKEKEIDLKKLEQINDISLLREQLLKFPGVGEKVADCIMLFSMKKYEVFPIDIWVKRVMTELYIEKNKKENGRIPLSFSQVNNKQILEIAHQKFGNLAGLAQQYLFYWRREQEKTKENSSH